MFKKIIYFSLFCFLLLYSLHLKAFSYDTFGGKYQYNVNSTNNINTSSDEEILLIVDFSASMRRPFAHTTRYIQATDSIESLLRQLPASTRIGMRIFGADSNEDKRATCTSTKLVSSIRNNNNSNVISNLFGREPAGTSPLTYTLRQAVESDFNNASASTIKHIVLVTDGKENCGEDPCQYIKRLMAKRNDIVIDVVGISLEDNAYSQLSCLANQTNGKLHIVNSIDDLNTMLKKAVTSQNTTPKEPVVASGFGTAYPPQSTAGFSPTVPPPSSANNTITSDINKPVLSKIKYNNYAFEFDM